MGGERVCQKLKPAAVKGKPKADVIFERSLGVKIIRKGLSNFWNKSSLYSDIDGAAI